MLDRIKHKKGCELEALLSAPSPRAAYVAAEARLGRATYTIKQQNPLYTPSDDIASAQAEFEAAGLALEALHRAAQAEEGGDA